ncbi:MAG: N-acetyltransferase [Planctomycetaceae bacterium]
MVGHVGFSPVTDPMHSFVGYILAPLAVRPEFQRQGIGTAVVEAGIQQLVEQGVDIVFVYGDPAYYARYGFEPASAASFHAPYPLQYPFGWQARCLTASAKLPAAATLTCVALRDPALW